LQRTARVSTSPPRDPFAEVLKQLDDLLTEAARLREEIGEAMRREHDRPFWPDRRREQQPRTPDRRRA
jgi:hypothetical protein